MDQKQYASMTARQIAAGVRAKEFSATEVTRVALACAHAQDAKLHAFVSILDDLALAAAQKSTIGRRSLAVCLIVICEFLRHLVKRRFLRNSLKAA